MCCFVAFCLFRGACGCLIWLLVTPVLGDAVFVGFSFNLLMVGIIVDYVASEAVGAGFVWADVVVCGLYVCLRTIVCLVVFWFCLSCYTLDC